MLDQMREALRRSETLTGDVLGCVALTILLIGGLHLPIL